MILVPENGKSWINLRDEQAKLEASFEPYKIADKEGSRRRCETLLRSLEAPLMDIVKNGDYIKRGGVAECWRDLGEIKRRYDGHVCLGGQVSGFDQPDAKSNTAPCSYVLLVQKMREWKWANGFSFVLQRDTSWLKFSQAKAIMIGSIILAAENKLSEEEQKADGWLMYSCLVPGENTSICW